MALTADQLAQFRGCDPENQCYADCVATARDAINDRDDPAELTEAWKWAKTQTWIPPLVDDVTQPGGAP